MPRSFAAVIKSPIPQRGWPLQLVMILELRVLQKPKVDLNQSDLFGRANQRRYRMRLKDSGSGLGSCQCLIRANWTWADGPKTCISLRKRGCGRGKTLDSKLRVVLAAELSDTYTP